MYRAQVNTRLDNYSDYYGQQSPGRLSYNVRDHQKAIHRIRQQSDAERTKFIVDTFTHFFREGISQDPKAFRGRFRKMATTPFKFYRGSAVLFYQDLKNDQDQYIAQNEAAGLIFIHGDLHAENFGTYLNNRGILNFDVNDFDEAYIGAFTWDLKRLLASLNLICHAKGFSDKDIERVLTVCANAYLQKIYSFCKSPKQDFALTIKTTKGRIKQLLNETRLKSRVANLDENTIIENYDRSFKRTQHHKEVNDSLRKDILRAFEKYLETIPESKRQFTANSRNGKVILTVKDVVARSSPGIGSAGKVSYSILLEGPSETLENDIMLYMKPAQKSAVSHVVRSPEIDQYFQHDGMRTVLCSYAMQAVTPPWLGYTTLNGTQCLVDEITAHSEDLEWDDINELEEICEVVEFLGQATAKIHCVADADCINTSKAVPSLPFSIIPKDTENTIHKAINGRDDQFLRDMVEFGMVYGEQVRRDHRLFFEVFRNNKIPGL